METTIGVPLIENISKLCKFVDVALAAVIWL